VILPRSIRWAGHVAVNEGHKKCLQHFGRKPESKKTLERLRRRWEDNIKVYLKEIGRKNVDWIELDKDRAHRWALVNTAMNLWTLDQLKDCQH
jgi:hypothetical protein